MKPAWILIFLPSISLTSWVRALGGGVTAALAALVLAGCATVDLTPSADVPQVRMPGDTPIRPAPLSTTEPPYTPSVQTMPVRPGGPSTQPLSLSDNVNDSADTPGASVADTHLVTLTTRLDGASAAPPTFSGATAQIDLLYDTGSRLLRWKAQWTGFSGPITGISFYGPAAQGQQGSPTLLWPGPFGPRYEGRATLTPQQATDLIGGLWYVNISTVNYPSGEIRGQVRVVY